jgi:predicted Zn-dependent protease with MMP-like domain
VSRRFEEQVQAALDELPPHIAAGLKNVAIVVEDEDPDEPDLFGLWQADEYLPDKITIFERPLTRAFRDPARLRAEIRITVLHELAHYFGLDEREIEELGYG